MNKSLLYTFIFLAVLTSCENPIKKTEYLSEIKITNIRDNECAIALTNEQIKKYNKTKTEVFTESDTRQLKDITDCIINCNGDSTEFEIFLNTRQNNLLVVDIYGLGSENQIRKTVCAAKDNNDLNLPDSTIFLFHKYEKKSNQYDIVYGLKLKP